MNTFLLYLVMKADDLIECCALLVTTCIGIIITLWMRHAMIFDYSNIKKEERKIENFKYIKYTFICAISFILLGTLCPSTKQLAVLYVAPKLYNNKELKQIPTKLIDLANKKLDEAINSK